MNEQDHYWDKVIILMDMNCFYAQVEQYDNPYLRNKPVAVTNGVMGSTIITSSYEARYRGVKTGMRLHEARHLCPNLIQAASRPKRYVEISTRIMEAMYSITPDVEVYSVDEAFLDVTQCQSLWGTPYEIGVLVKKAVKRVSGLTCSVGISGDKTTAKYAAKLHKPDGLTLIAPWDSERVLAPLKVTELSGINTGIASFLARYGVIHCQDMKKIPISIPAQRFGNLGRRIWLMAQGKDPDPIHTEINAPKTVGHGKVLPPNINDREIVLTYFHHMSEKVGVRLRRHGLKAGEVRIGFKVEKNWLGSVYVCNPVLDDGRMIYRLCQQFMNEYWQKQTIRSVQVTASNLMEHSQTDLFFETSDDEKHALLNTTLDSINSKYGDFTVAPLRLLAKSEMPDVIAPSWKPHGHRKTV
jgi:DNA polymerase-4